MAHSYLPSKQFIFRGSAAVGIVAVILIVQTAWFKNLFHKKPAVQSIAPQTVGDLIVKDSNGNGIADWEERLWGLDPTVVATNGVPNKDIIEQKKRALGITNGADQPTNKTDAIARQLFAISTALGQSDKVDDQSVKKVASNIGNSVDIKKVSNHYSLSDIKRVPTTTASLLAYHRAISMIIDATNTENADIALVITGLQTGNFSNIGTLDTTAKHYRDFAEAMKSLSVPIGLASYHLDIMNGFYGVADSFTFLGELGDNGIDGLAGIAIYKKYDQLLEGGLFQLHQYLVEYGILKS